MTFKFKLRIENLTHVRLRGSDSEWYKVSLEELKQPNYYIIKYRLTDNINVELKVDDDYALSKLVDKYELKFKNDFYV